MIKHTEEEIKKHSFDSAILEIENVLNGDDVSYEVAHMLGQLKSHYSTNWYLEHEREYRETGMSDQELQEFMDEERKVESYTYEYLVQMIKALHDGLLLHEKGDDK